MLHIQDEIFRPCAESSGRCKPPFQLRLRVPVEFDSGGWKHLGFADADLRFENSVMLRKTVYEQTECEIHVNSILQNAGETQLTRSFCCWP
jgi:hypothetical protein